MLAYGRDSGVLTGRASGVGTWEGQFLGFFSGFSDRAGEISGVLHNEASSHRGVGTGPKFRCLTGVVAVRRVHH